MLAKTEDIRIKNEKIYIRTCAKYIFGHESAFLQIDRKIQTSIIIK